MLNGIIAQPLLVELAIEPKTRADHEKLRVALKSLAADDPSFRAHIDNESGQIVLKGMSEDHLAGKIEILKASYKVEANVGAPQVAYRETITRTVEQDYTHKKQTGGSGQYAKVKIRFEPLPAGSGFEFENDVVGGSVPKEYVPGVEKGLTAIKETGTIAGFPMIDFKATLIDGDYHVVDSNVLTFDIAARACYREGIPKASPKLLEPIMRVEVVTPDDYVGATIGDLKSRRGRIGGPDRRGISGVLVATVPLANMFGYADALRAMSEGRATFTMQFERYAEVPPFKNDPPFGPAIGMRA